MHFHNKEKDKNNNRVTAAITIFTLGIIFASTANAVIATTSNWIRIVTSTDLG